MSGVTYVDFVPLGTDVAGRFINGPALVFGTLRIGLGSHPDPIAYLDAVEREVKALRNEIQARAAEANR